MEDLLKIQRPTSDCGKPVIKLECYSTCKDNFTGEFYGNGTILAESGSLSSYFPFHKITNLRGFVSRMPREITRTVSLKCATQKVSSSRIWQIQGADMYPAWKMDELEDMLQAETIKIDDEEVVYRAKDAPFSQIHDSCTGLFKLRLDVEECTIQQIYGCGDNCTTNEIYIRIPVDNIQVSNIGNAKYYNSNRALIADSYDNLKLWLRNQNGVTDVSEVTPEDLNCDYYKILKVTGTKGLPNVIYLGNPISGNKIFGKILDAENPDYNDLCNGQDSTLCAAPVLGTPTIYELTCEDIELGVPIITQIGGDCDIELVNDWEQYSGDTKITPGVGVNSIDLSIFNAGFKGSEGGDTTYNYTVGSDSECTLDIPNSLGATISGVSLNSEPIDPDNYTFDPSTGEIDFTPMGCLSAGTVVSVRYHTAGSGNPYYVSGQTIAKIIGGCLPVNDVYIMKNCNDSMPENSTIIIQSDGQIKWFGFVSESDDTGSVIEVTNITYSV